MQRLFSPAYFTILMAGIVLTPIGFAEHVIWARWIGVLSLSAWALVNMVRYVIEGCGTSELWNEYMACKEYLQYRAKWHVRRTLLAVLGHMPDL